MKLRPWIAVAVLSLVPIGLLAAEGDSSSAKKPESKTESPDHDRRADPLRDLNTYSPFTPPETKAAWDARAEKLRRQMQVALGLWPLPERTPPHAVIHGRVERDGYTVDRVYFESYPGFYVTGSLYRPTGKTGRLPGVLCPHGHWNDGRNNASSLEVVRKQIADGAEKFEIGGAHPLQARCVQLARMGCVVFHWDMIGYVDSVQIPITVAHKLMHRRPEMETAEGWGFLTPQADLHAQSIMGLQAYNAVRALDFLRDLPDVDPERIASTGASGGGTQTFTLSAIDPRLSVAFPAVMVSTGMQGGCTCENCSYLRIGTGNVEIAGLTAPRPLGMTYANDWTKEMPTKGLPELKKLYAMLGVPDRVEGTAFLQFGHNYNSVSRQVMYEFLNKQFKLGQKEPIVEHDYVPLTPAEMTVWDDNHPKPSGGVEFERTLTKEIAAINDKQMAALKPHDEKSLAEYRRVVGGAWDVMLGGGMPAKDTLANYVDPKGTNGHVVVRQSAHPGQQAPSGTVVVWISKAGSDALPTNGKYIGPIKSLCDAGFGLVAPHLFGQSGSSPEISKNRRVKGDRDFPGFTYGYNSPLFAERVQDIVATIADLKTQKNVKQIYLVGLDETGPLVAAAWAQAGSAISRAVINTGGFRFANVKEFDDAMFLPGSAKYGDLPSLLALGAPHETYILGEGEKLPELVKDAYQAAGKPDNAIVAGGTGEAAEAAALKWLMRP